MVLKPGFERTCGRKPWTRLVRVFKALSCCLAGSVKVVNQMIKVEDSIPSKTQTDSWFGYY